LDSLDPENGRLIKKVQFGVMEATNMRGRVKREDIVYWCNIIYREEQNRQCWSSMASEEQWTPTDIESTDQQLQVQIIRNVFCL